MSEQLDITFLLSKNPRYGAHSGYEIIASYIRRFLKPRSTVRPQRSIVTRMFGKAYATYRGWPTRDQSVPAAECYFGLLLALFPQSLGHILYVEHHLPYLGTLKKSWRNFIGTIHEPERRWQPDQLKDLSKLASALILYKRDIEFFEQYIGKGAVHFILHGVDTDFFVPPPTEPAGEPRLLFVGVHLRNNTMLRRIIERLSAKYPEMSFDLVVPDYGRKNDDMRSLERAKSVRWHQDLTDDELRNLYQHSHLLLMPINDGGANNAIVESLSTGLPIVTTDCGGIRDYGGGTLFPVVANNDDDAMIALVEKYLDSKDLRSSVSRKTRQFAEENLPWTLIAQKHIELYRRLLN